MSKNIEIDKCFGDASLKLLAKCGKVFLLRGCILEIFYFLSKVESIFLSFFFFLSTVLFNSSSEVYRLQKESVVIGRQSNVVGTSVTASKILLRKRCVRLVRCNRIRREYHTNVGKTHIS